jgi:hydrogenase maturation protein HypF
LTRRAPLLLLGIGNPSRGDDALGPLFVERAAAALAEEIARGELECLTDFQLQIEHALDLEGRRRVFFVDASVRAAPPFELSPVAPRPSTAVTSHAMSPEAVLDTYRRTVGEPPEAWMLAIRAERFELGDPLSPSAEAHLGAALERLLDELRGGPREVSSRGRRLTLEGTVQGVGLRPWIHRTARGLGLSGSVWNTRRGVTIEAFGPVAALDAFVTALQTDAPPAARVRALASVSLPWRDARGFTIAPSDCDGAADGEAKLALPPDLATCDACLRDLGDPGDRHFGYAFTSCAECGPRFAIARELPYDRATTTMAGFVPCPACAAERASPDDRRFHAETVACPACGPRVWLEDPAGLEIAASDPIAAASALLLDGKLLGAQGLGAFHLVCDATNAEAVAELRRRKRRDAQPLAVMVADLASACAIAALDDSALRALASPARPIVLLPPLASTVVPEVLGPSRRVGVMLPYTPLHQLLTASVRRPLVVTSGNVSGGPAVIDAREARTALRGLVDALLLHDRPIARRVEDSVVDGSGARPRILRRARGFAPAPIRLPVTAPEPVLAVGAHLKNTACVVVGDLAYLTPHLGDLGLVESERAWIQEVESFERLLGVRAAVLAHDLHPEYASTRYALGREARRKIGVQHHAAHAYAAIAELHLDEPVVAVVCDGSGWGPDVTSWGGELLLVDGPRWRRVSSLRALPLPGGERAIREVWRAAFGALAETFGREEALALARRLALFDAQPSGSLATLATMIETGTSTVRARGVGRWFDAVGALALAIPRAGFEGHVAIALEEAIDPAASAPPYPVDLPSELALDVELGPAHELDLRPTLRAVVGDLLDGAPIGRVAARFHATLVEALSSLAARTLAVTGLRRVVLSGGSFQNRTLERGLVARLGADRVATAREVPLNDGGISLGQAYRAALALTVDSE